MGPPDTGSPDTGPRRRFFFKVADHESIIAERNTVLAGDDNPENLNVLRSMLEPAGFRVRIARDGDQVLASAAAEPPDIILLDVHMPRKDGYETCGAIRSNADLAEIPIIFVSALADPFNKRQAFELGAVDYFEKPLRMETVVKRLRNAIALTYYRRRCRDLEAVLAEMSTESGTDRDK